MLYGFEDVTCCHFKSFQCHLWRNINWNNNISVSVEEKAMASDRFCVPNTTRKLTPHVTPVTQLIASWKYMALIKLLYKWVGLIWINYIVIRYSTLDQWRQQLLIKCKTNKSHTIVGILKKVLLMGERTFQYSLLSCHPGHFRFYSFVDFNSAWQH